MADSYNYFIGGAFMSNDTKILRSLAYKYAEIANSEKNSNNMFIHSSVNDLHQIRPVVMIDELPWSEMNINNELTLMCEDSYLKKVEWFFRSNLYKHKYMPADMIFIPYLPVGKIVNSTGIGITTAENILATDSNNRIVSHDYIDVLNTEEDFAKLQNPVISYNEKSTLERFNLVSEILGDIMPVRLTGVNTFYSVTWDDISRYRGVSNLLIDLADRPDFMHRIVRQLTDFQLDTFNQYEELGLLDTHNYNLHCTPGLTNDLPIKEAGVTRSDIWGRGTAQIFASVSPAMHNEFDIDYMIETVGQCGLSYYGCCEPLDGKIDIVERIPNLRKISITPWANVNIAAEAIGKKYVLSSKPNPAKVAVPKLDKDDLKREINEILDACKRNNCNCDIVLKDISSCNGRPENIFEWEQIVMELVRSY